MSEPRFFFVRGFMKSGTNWLGSLLSSHAHISVVGEYHWEIAVHAFNRLQNSQAIYGDVNYASDTREYFEDFVRKCLIRRAEPGAKLIGERTPHTILPITMRKCPVISIIRDGRDVLVSRAFHLFNEPNVHRLFQRIPEMAKDLEEFKKDPWFFKKHPEMLLRHEEMFRESVVWWREHIESDRAALEKFPNLPAKFVHYEALHQDTEGRRRELFEFLDVDPDKAANIDGHLAPGFKEERPTEFLRKGAVGDWRNYFTEENTAWFKEEGGQELINQGYEKDFDWTA